MDPLVTITSVKDVSGVHPQTLAPDPQRVVEFTVGQHGPFQLVTPARSFTSDYVDVETQKVVDHLKAIGAIKP